MEQSCPDNNYLIRKRVGELAGALDEEIHRKASEFCDWLLTSVGHHREVFTSESDPALRPA